MTQNHLKVVEVNGCGSSNNTLEQWADITGNQTERPGCYSRVAMIGLLWQGCYGSTIRVLWQTDSADPVTMVTSTDIAQLQHFPPP